MTRAAILALPLTLALAACATANRQPSPQAASVTVPTSYAYAPVADAAARASVAALLPTQDADFAALIARAEANAPDLAAALARIDAARALATRARAERRPAVDADANITGNRSSGQQIGGNLPPGVQLNLDRLSFGGNITARWDADLFGVLRAQQRAAEARLDAATADAAAVRLALTAEIAARVIDWRTLTAREATLREDLAAAQDLRRLASIRARAGVVPEADVVRADGLVADAEARLAPLSGERGTVSGQLATLVAMPVPDILTMLAAASGERTLATVSSAPSDLIRDRPDVAAAAARLTAADADVAAAAAQRFPRFTLSSAIGLLAFALGDVFDSDALVGSLSAGVSGPLLDFGRVQADVDRASASTREAFALYRGAVFTALGESEAAFASVDAVDAQSRALARQAAIEEDATRLATVRYRNGLSDFTAVIDARRAANATRIASAVAEGQRARARVVLWQALGGSLEN
jgi:NodT family efflux transporter outer membrane factor (OMF) lipoprotein